MVVSRMQYYQTSQEKCQEQTKDVYKIARKLYAGIRGKSPHIRSAYLIIKIFLQYFWGHLYAKRTGKIACEIRYLKLLLS